METLMSKEMWKMGVLAKLTQLESSLEDMPKDRGLLKQSSEDTDYSLIKQKIFVTIPP